MKKLSKRFQILNKKIDCSKKYKVIEAINILKKYSMVKFTESIDVAINVYFDNKKSNKNISGTVILPHGTGKKLRIAVFAKQISHIKEAYSAGADLVGSEEISNQIKEGKFNFDVAISSSDEMDFVNELSSILGPKGLMPSIKTETITENITETIKKIKLGRIIYKSDKYGIIHSTIGKVSFESFQLKENFETLFNKIKINKIKQKKGKFIKSIYISTTMGLGIKIDDRKI